MIKKYNFWQKFRNIPKIDDLQIQIKSSKIDVSKYEDAYDRCNERTTIEIEKLKDENINILKILDSNESDFIELENQNKDLENQLIKQNIKNPETFKTETFDKLETYTQKYDYDGKGEKPIQMCLGITDEGKKYYKKKLISPFVKKNKKNYMLHNIDKLVLDFTSPYIYNKKWKYTSDMKNFGKKEMFSKPLAALILAETKGIDCDEFSIILYNALKLLLIEFGFESEIWRLQCMIVDVITGGRHFNLAWLKSDIADWVFIETTYYKSTTIKSFENNIGLKQNLLYNKIVYSFDSDSCRRKLN
jgi:hypothetical protein